MSGTKLERSLKRNLDELARCILNLKAIKGLESADTYHAIDFVRISHWALFDDCFTHAMRVFDEHRGAASFWYLERCDPTEIETALANAGLAITDLKLLSASLKIVRNKTHFHIDQRSVRNPAAVWQRADIKRSTLESLLQRTFQALNELHIKWFGEEFWLPEYDGADAQAIAEFAEGQSWREDSANTAISV